MERLLQPSRMPTYSLLQARQISNALIDQGVEAQISQVSQHRFTVDAPYVLEAPKTKEEFVFNHGWVESAKKPLRRFWLIMAGCLVFVLGGLIASLAVAPEAVPPVASISPNAVWLETLDGTELDALIAEHKLELSSNVFVEVKRIELGGYLVLLVNQSLGDETRFLRLELSKTETGWQIEKWVQLE